MTSARVLNYFGSKVQAAHRYPEPKHKTIIEPFCGGAGYSLNYRSHNVVLVDRNPEVIRAWQYVIRSAPEEILDLPLLEPGEPIPKHLGRDERLLIGWNVGMNGSRPQGNLVPCAARVPSSFWGESKRLAISKIAAEIKHWQAFVGDYKKLVWNGVATWFIDPPYAGKIGRNYMHGSDAIDFDHLANFCQTRNGQVIVCEGPGADWLPFQEHHVHASAPTADVVGRRTSKEMIWTK